MPKTKKQSTEKRKKKIKEAMPHSRSKETITSPNVTPPVMASQNLPLPSPSISSSVSSHQNVTPSPTISRNLTPSATTSRNTLPSMTTSQNVTQSPKLSRNVTPSASASRNVTPSASAPRNVTPSMMTSRNVTPSASASRNVTPSASAPRNVTPSMMTSRNVTPSMMTSRNVTPSMMTSRNVTPSMMTSRNVTPSASASRNVTPSASAPRNVTPSMMTSRNVTPSMMTSRNVTPSMMTSRNVTPSMMTSRNVNPSASASLNVKDRCGTKFSMIQYWDMQERLQKQQMKIQKTSTSYNTEWRAKRRSHPDVRRKEQLKDTERRWKRRQNSDIRQKEQAQDTDRQQRRRNDPAVKDREKIENTEWRKKKRIDPAVKEKEKIENTEWRKKRRIDPAMKEKEKIENTEWRKKRRIDPAVKEKEKIENTEWRKKRRIDPAMKEKEKIENTEWRKKRRIDPAVKEKEKIENTEWRKKRRIDPAMKEKEKIENTEWRKKRRIDPAVKEKEKIENTKWRKKRRINSDIHQTEQAQDTYRRQKKRIDPAVKDREKIENTEWRKKRRIDPAVKEKEKIENTEWRKKRRIDPAKKRQDNVKKASSRQRQREVTHTMTISDKIRSFHKQIEHGPTFTCSSCHQLWYKHSVVSYQSTNLPPCDALKECVPDGVNHTWLCHTCLKYLQDKKFPPCAIANGMAFPPEPENLTDLHKLEWRLVSPRIAFMKIYEAPRGGQYKIHGNVVNVPTDVVTTHTSLPRLKNEDATIKVKLKRHLKNHVLSENVRPEKVRQAAEYLSTHGQLFKDEGIVYNTSWEPDDTSAPAQEGQGSPSAQPMVQPVLDTVHPASSTQSADDDVWSEPEEDDKDEMPGEMNTMLTSPDFLEDHERDLLFTVAPGQNSTPVSIFRYKHSEELAFPNIFYGQRRLENSERHVPVYYSEVCKSEARRVDRRLVKDVDNLFFKAKELQMKQMLDKVQIALRKCKSSGLTLNAKTFKDRDNLQDYVFKDVAYKFLNTIRGSPPYFQAINKDLFAMIRQLGPATFFASFSAAETRWVHLLKILAKVVNDQDLTNEQIEELTWHERCKLIQSDPVTVTRHFHHQVQALFTFLQSDLAPIGELEDFFRRLEFQQRGSAHIHSLFWIKDSPKPDTDSPEDIVQYIDSILTCHKPTEEEDKELADLVKYQMHRHSHTCRKGKNTCRFHYPLPPMKSTKMLTPLQADEEAEIPKYEQMWKRIQTELNGMKMGEDITFEEFLARLKISHEDYILVIRSSIKDITIFLKRTPSEIRVNQYNPILLKAWRANMDMQFVTNVYACATYIASYVTKAQRGMSQLLRKATQEAKEVHGESIRQQFREVVNRFVNSVEICAQEAATLILQLPMRKSSRVTVFVNTNLQDDRVFLLKPQHILMNMKDDDENIESSSLITKYQQRPDDLEAVTLAEFACFYTLKAKSKTSRNQSISNKTVDGYLPETEVQETKQDEESEDTTQESPETEQPCVDQPSGSSVTLVQAEASDKIYSKRKIPRILRYCRFSKNKEPEKHYRELVMLFTAWRNEKIDLIQGFDTYQQKFQQYQDSIHTVQQQFEPFSEQVDLAAENLQNEREPQAAWDQIAPQAEHQQAKDAELEQLQSTEEPESYDFADDLGLRVQVDQSEFQPNHELPDNEFREKMRKLNKQQMEFLYEVLHHAKTSQEPLYYFLSGGAGVGKTFVSNLLFQALLKFLNKEAGMDPDKPRILLMAPTGKAAYLMKGQTIHSALRLPVSQKLQFTALNTDSLNTLRTSMQQVRYIFIDEVSMVGTSMLNFIHKRLQEVTGSAKDFGGISIIAVGDLFQLKPVCDAYMFENASTAYSPLAVNLWKKHFHLFELNQIMRQDNSCDFAKMLNRMREGKQTTDDINLLQSRNVTRPSPLYQTVSDYPHLFLRNDSVEAHNQDKFLSSQTVKREVRAIDTVVSSADSTLEEAILARVPDDPRRTLQLHSLLKLAINLHYDLSLNVRTDDGLTNGASCVVKQIATAENGRACGIVWVQFSDLDVGRKTREDHKALYRGSRDQQWTPIIPITKRFNMGKNAEVTRTQFPLRPSSAKTVHRAQGDTMKHVVADFKGRCEAHIHYVACSRVQSIDDFYLMNLEPKKIKVSDKVQKEMTRLRSQPFTASLTQLCTVTADIKLVFHNAQSLNKHILDVEHDFNLQAADILFCAETRFISTDTETDTNIRGFKSFRNDSTIPSTSRPFHGLAAYYNTDRVTLQPSSVNHKKVEIITCQVRLQNSTDMLVIGLYNPPRSPIKDVINALFNIFRSIAHHRPPYYHRPHLQ